MLSAPPTERTTMGVSTTYLGHIEITPPLNQAEYDYLRMFSRSRRSHRDGGPYGVWPRDPHDEAPMLHGDEAAARANQIAEGQPGYWCQWVPCPHGCCLGWDGQEKFYAGSAWLQYVIDHFLRPGAHARRSKDVQFRRFTFDHDTNGVLVGEQQDNRELFSLTVRHGKVTRRTLRAGDTMPWDAGYVETAELPWLSPEISLSELYRRENDATLAEVRASPAAEGG
jgi:hypothetical protein